MFDSDKVTNCAVAFTTVAAGVLCLALARNLGGMRALNKARATEALANAHRQASLAKLYDAREAKLAMQTLKKAV